MKVYRLLERIFLTCIRMTWICFIMIHECKNLLKKYHLFKNVKLSAEQKKQIDDYYRKYYGKKIPYWWHRLYTSYTGKFDYRYTPDYIYTVKIEPYSNSRLHVLPLEDKNMQQVLFAGDLVVKMPEMLLMRVKGQFFDDNRRFISRDKAVEILTKHNRGIYDAVIKVSVDANSGRGVRMLKMANGVDMLTEDSIEQVFDAMGEDFVVQEKIRPHPAFAKLYSPSVNTFRIVTYMLNNRASAVSVIMRIGQGGGVVDNAHAGGMFIGVTDDGRLLKEAFTEYQKRFTSHPDTGIIFENYQLPFVPEIREAAVRMHQRLPMLRFISWDFTVDADDQIILIEANLHSQTIWFSQMAHGEATFKDDTAEILALAKNRGKERSA